MPRITCGILDYLCLNKRLGNLKKKNVCEMARAMSMEVTVLFTYSISFPFFKVFCEIVRLRLRYKNPYPKTQQQVGTMTAHLVYPRLRPET